MVNKYKTSTAFAIPWKTAVSLKTVTIRKGKTLPDEDKTGLTPFK